MNPARADSEIQRICRQLVANDQCLTILNLASQYIYDEDVFQLAAAMTENTSVVVVILSGNCIKDNGARYLAAALPPCVQYLYLGHNNIGNEGARVLAKLTHLKILDLHSNHIMDEGAQHMARLVSNAKKLQSLRLDTNEIGVRGICSLANALRTNTTLHTLRLNENTKSSEGYNTLKEVFESNASLMSISYSCPGRRSLQSVLDLYRDLHRSLRDIDLLPKYWPTLLQKFQSEIDILHVVVRERPDIIGRYP